MFSNPDITPEILHANLKEDMQARLLRPKFALNENAKNLEEADLREPLVKLRARINDALPYRRLFLGTPHPEYAAALDRQMAHLVDAYIAYAVHFITAQSQVQLEEMLPGGAGKRRKAPGTLMQEFMPFGSSSRNVNDTLCNMLLKEMTTTYRCMEAMQKEESCGVLLGKEVVGSSRIALGEALEFVQSEVESFRENLHMKGSHVPAGQNGKAAPPNRPGAGETATSLPAPVTRASFALGVDPTRGDNPKGTWRR